MSFSLKFKPIDKGIVVYRNTRVLATLCPNWRYPYWLSTYKCSLGTKEERWWVYYSIDGNTINYPHQNESLPPSGILKYELMKKKWLK